MRWGGPSSACAGVDLALLMINCPIDLVKQVRQLRILRIVFSGGDQADGHFPFWDRIEAPVPFVDALEVLELLKHDPRRGVIRILLSHVRSEL